jgi:FkbM family methyltransferase
MTEPCLCCREHCQSGCECRRIYSQHDEELYILEAVKDIERGTFLDVGAYDGIQFSNVRALVERGWSGTMVEPGIEAFQKLLGNYRHNYNVQLVHAAIGDKRSSLFADNPTTYSTTDEASFERFKYQEPFSRHFLIPMMSWRELLARTVPPDVLSIDTEGTSVGLLSKYPFRTGGTPRVVCVEHDDNVDGCDSVVAKYGYAKVYLNETNVVYSL